MAQKPRLQSTRTQQTRQSANSRTTTKRQIQPQRTTQQTTTKTTPQEQGTQSYISEVRKDGTKITGSFKPIIRTETPTKTIIDYRIIKQTRWGKNGNDEYSPVTIQRLHFDKQNNLILKETYATKRRGTKTKNVKTSETWYNKLGQATKEIKSQYSRTGSITKKTIRDYQQGKVQVKDYLKRAERYKATKEREEKIREIKQKQQTIKQFQKTIELTKPLIQWQKRLDQLSKKLEEKKQNEANQMGFYPIPSKYNLYGISNRFNPIYSPVDYQRIIESYDKKRMQSIKKYYGNLPEHIVKELKDPKFKTTEEIIKGIGAGRTTGIEIIDYPKIPKNDKKIIFRPFSMDFATSIPKELYNPTLTKEQNLDKIYNEIQAYYGFESPTKDEISSSLKARTGLLYTAGSFVIPISKTGKIIPHIQKAGRYGLRAIGLGKTIGTSLSPENIQKEGLKQIEQNYQFSPAGKLPAYTMYGIGTAGIYGKKGLTWVEKKTDPNMINNKLLSTVAWLPYVASGMGKRALDQPLQFTYGQKAFSQSVKAISGGIAYTAPSLKIGQKTSHILGRIAGDIYDVGSDLVEVLPHTKKEAWPTTIAGLTLANYALDAPFTTDIKHPYSYTLKPHDVKIDKFRKKEFSDLSKITKIATSTEMKIGDMRLERIEGSNAKLAKDLKTFLKKQKEGFAGGSVVHETTGITLAKRPADLEWYTDDTSFVNKLSKELTSKGHSITSTRGAVYVDDVKIDVNPLRTGISNIETVSPTRHKWQKYIIQSKDGINIINPRILTRRALVGAYEKGGRTNEPMARYRKDIPRLITLLDAQLKYQLGTINKQKLLTQIRNVKTGYAIELLKRYEIPKDIKYLKPIKYRGYTEKVKYRKPLTKTDSEVINYVSKKGAYLGGSSALYFQIPGFRKYGDIDIYFKKGTDIKPIANKVLEITRQKNKGVYLEKATSHIKIKNKKGKDLYDIGIRSESKDKIIKINDIRMRKANQILADKRQITKHTKQTSKWQKAIKDLDLADKLAEKSFGKKYTLKNRWAMFKALGYIDTDLKTFKKLIRSKKGQFKLTDIPSKKLTKKDIVGSGKTEMFMPGYVDTKTYETLVSRPYKKVEYTQEYPKKEDTYPYKRKETTYPYPESTYQYPETIITYPYIKSQTNYPYVYPQPSYPYTETSETYPYSQTITEISQKVKDKKRRLRILQELSKALGHQPMLYDKNKKILLPPYETYYQAIMEGMRATDETPFNKFTIKSKMVNQGQIQKGRTYRKTYKFKKVGDTWREKRYYRFDNKNEILNKFIFRKI